MILYCGRYGIIKACQNIGTTGKAVLISVRCPLCLARGVNRGSIRDCLSRAFTCPALGIEEHLESFEMICVEREREREIERERGGEGISQFQFSLNSGGVFFFLRVTRKLASKLRAF